MPISHAYGTFAMLGEEFEDPFMEQILEAYDGTSVFTLLNVLDYLLPILRERFYAISKNVPKLMNAGCDADTAERGAVAYIDANSAVDLGEDMLLAEIEQIIRHHGDPEGLLPPGTAAA